MKKLQKILCIMLVFALVAAFAFTLAACDNTPDTTTPNKPDDDQQPLTPAQKEQIRQELVDSFSADIPCGETGMTLTDDEGQITKLHAVWETEEADEAEPIVNADVIVAQYNQEDSNNVNATVVFIRGEDAYGANVDLEVYGADKIDGINSQMSQIMPLLVKKTAEEWLKYLSEQLDVNLGILGEVLPNLDGAGNVQMLAEMLKPYFTKIDVTDDGYTVSCNFDKLADDLWVVATAIAEFVDQHKDFYLNELYQDEEFIALLTEADLTAEQLQELVTLIIERANSQLPQDEQIEFSALAPQEGETAYEYLGRYLDMELPGGKTVGDTTVEDLLCIIFGTTVAPDLSTMMDILKWTTLPFLKQELKENVTFQLNFDKDKNLTSIVLVVNGYANITVHPQTSVTLTQLAQ